MSLLEELKKEVAKRNPLNEKRAQIEALRKKAQEAFNTQFLMNATNKEQIAYLQGRISAFTECIELFMEEEEKSKEQEERKWEEDN